MPVHIIWCLIIPTVGSSASGAEAKFGSQKWWQCGNSSDMIIGRQRSYLCGQGFERLSEGACILLDMQVVLLGGKLVDY